MKPFQHTVIGVWLLALAIPLPRPKLRPGTFKGPKGASCGFVDAGPHPRLDGGPGSSASTASDYASRALRKYGYTGTPMSPAAQEELLESLGRFHEFEADQLLEALQGGEGEELCVHRNQEARDTLAARSDDLEAAYAIGRWRQLCDYTVEEAELRLGAARSAAGLGNYEAVELQCERLEVGELIADKPDEQPALPADFEQARAQLCGEELLVGLFRGRVEEAEDARASAPDQRPQVCYEPYEDFWKLRRLAEGEPELAAVIERWWGACLSERERAEGIHDRFSANTWDREGRG